MAETPLWSSRLHDEGTTRIVALGGELDLAAADELRLTLIDQLDQPTAEAVVADLSAVIFLDSAALGALVAALNHCHRTGKSFTITGASPSVRQVLDITGVYQLLIGNPD
ncbi:stage II sporulation protein AA (anti-sigma F factor antagonist) [Actinoplanes lutulentus]|uniref:Anti-sigma factor antagonist n=1 Tax=Actinoplanes lutulentus TaxID=1287878 RepID=A0A327Z325_9ACTN|nr:STAS domain-containing protein [Actinoplanes lutulentus]MBB2948817.1 stage II sporulation protein AA (anti-sigma F factor antagonist) [Actinoplanes lutulentus]RAK29729.1 SpoIIAA-like anti-anti-sigma regulatory factor [Actinoplanes lutulentus]